jgi:hypothetical protein
MLKLEKLNRNSLEAVRQTLGVGPEDASKDDVIARMDPIDYVERYAQWHLGDRSWGSTFYGVVMEANDARA